MAASLGRNAYIVNLMSLQSNYFNNCILQVAFRFTNNQTKRFLYGPVRLGTDGYVEARKRSIIHLGPMIEKFRPKMEEYLTNDGQNIVFTEDLRNMIHIADNNSDDLKLCKKMLEKFHSQSENIRFSSFKFGPVVMRMLHHLNRPDDALEMITSPNFASFFSQVSSYIIAMDLLYKNEKYQDVLTVFSHLRENEVFISRFPRDCVVLTMASCFKLNTRESYEYGLELLKKTNESGAILLRKAITFMAALALKQNEPSVALEVLHSTMSSNYVTVRNLKLLAFAQIGRIDDCFAIMRSIINDENPNRDFQASRSGNLCVDVLESIKSAIGLMENKEVSHQFEQFYKAFEQGGHVKNTSLDEILCLPILDRDLSDRYQHKNTGQRPFRRNNEGRYERDGLTDMD